MDLLIFTIVYPVIWLISKLPMKVLYAFSDFIFVIIYYLIGYRKEVVRKNLKFAFPEKSIEERLLIEKKSILHFIDIFMEMIKSFSITEKEISKRFIFKNPEIINGFYDKNKSIILMGGHYANWEWAALYITKNIKHEGYGAFKKIKNKYFDRKIKKSRNKFGSNLIETKEFVKLMQENINNNHLALYGLLSDQSPKLKKTHYWGNFMGIKVPVQTGPEMLSKKFDLPVIYLKTERLKRGYYECTIKVLVEFPRDFKDYEITDLFTKELETQIKNKPEFYFWTHNRFKYMKNIS
jgi:Kdo2-lipid IVA lauroyltransferase/acyltransferase